MVFERVAGRTLGLILVAAACSETMTPRPVARVEVEPDSIRLASGDSATFTARALDAGANVLAGRTITWSVDDNALASVSDAGLVTTVWHSGTVIRQVRVIASAEGVADTARITLGPATVTSVEVTPDSTYLRIGTDLQMSATVRDAVDRTLHERSVTWATADSSVARVSTTGVVTANSPGVALITASTDGAADTATVVVGNLDVVMKWPLEGAFVSDTVVVAADVVSLFSVAQVSARIGGVTAAMAYGPAPECASRLGILPCWTATMDIVGEPLGPIAVEVTAVDAAGEDRTASVSVQHDPPPSLVVTSPRVGSVATPDLSLVVECSDRNAVQCASVSVRVDQGSVLATGGSAIDTQVSLAAYDGQQPSLIITATDSAGQVTQLRRDVWVLAGLPRIVDAAGSVLDFSDGRALVSTPETAGGETLRILQPGDTTTVFDVVGRQSLPGSAFLTSAGAIFVSEEVGASTSHLLHEHRGGVTTTLAGGYVSHLAVEGDFALWRTSQDPPLYLRNLATTQTDVVATDAANTGYDVSDEGNVAYWTQGSQQIRFVPLGGTAVDFSGPLQNTYPLVDDTLVVYRRHSAGFADSEVRLLSPSGVDLGLTPPVQSSLEAGRDYAIRDGWVAYTQHGTAAEVQVWVRAPAGDVTQVTQFGSRSEIEALGSAGRVVLAHAGARYLAESPYTTLVPLGKAAGRVLWRDGTFVVLLGGSVFTLP